MELLRIGRNGRSIGQNSWSPETRLRRVHDIPWTTLQENGCIEIFSVSGGDRAHIRGVSLPREIWRICEHRGAKRQGRRTIPSTLKRCAFVDTLQLTLTALNLSRTAYASFALDARSFFVSYEFKNTLSVKGGDRFTCQLLNKVS